MARKPVGVSNGVLSRAARGEGAICPRCRTFAPMGVGGIPVCTSCGGQVKREITKNVPRVHQNAPVRVSSPVPSRTLGKTRAPTEAVPVVATVAEAPAVRVPEEPAVEKLEPVASEATSEVEPLDSEHQFESKRRRR